MGSQNDDREGLSILIIEDSPTQAQALAHMLERHGYRCVVARNGRVALDLLRTSRPSLIISDVIMPEMGGFEFCRSVKTNDSLKDIPVILLTTLSDTSDIIRGLECRADNFVTKPYEDEYLRARIEHLLANRRLRRREQPEADVTVEFGGQRHLITSERRQILDLLLSTYEQAVHINRKLRTREQELEASNARLAALHAIGGAVSRSLDLAQVLNDALDQLMMTVGIDVALVFLLESGELVMKAHRNLPNDLAASIEQRPIDVRRTGGFSWLQEPFVGSVNLAPPALAETMRRIDCDSVMCVPLLAKGVVNGLLLVGTASGENFTRADIDLMRGVGQQLAVAIENARLYEAQRVARAQAEQANRAKDEFLAMVSHELRTPLNAILGWTKLLHAGRLGPAESSQAMEAVLRASLTQNQLVNDLLDVSRIISGKLAFNKTEVRMPFVVKAALETVHQSAETKGVRLESHIEPEVGVVIGDPARLQQVVTNLLTNAIKFTPQGGSVELRLTRSDSKAEISIRDTGQGIAPEILPHIFERFRQADNSITRQHGGLGLGLAIVRHLVERHGGTVSATSPGVGQGATFTVTLPVVDTPVEPGEPAVGNRQEEVADVHSLALNDVRVLVVDDQPDARELLSRVLAQYAAEVIVAASAAEALDALSRLRPHVLISDLAMPGEDGYNLIRKVRMLPPEQGGQIPAIAVSALGLEDRTRALASGFQHFFIKPIDPPEVVAVITDLLDSRR